MKRRSIFIFVISVFCSGCSTIISHCELGGDYNSEQPFGVYNGVRTDYNLLTNRRTFGSMLPDQQKKRAFYISYSIVDFPFSLVGDTLFLPIDLVSISGD